MCSIKILYRALGRGWCTTTLLVENVLSLFLNFSFQLMKYIVKLQSKGAAIGDELMALFEGDLNPVAPKAQKKVPVPEG